MTPQFVWFDLRCRWHSRKFPATAGASPMVFSQALSEAGVDSDAVPGIIEIARRAVADGG